MYKKIILVVLAVVTVGILYLSSVWNQTFEQAKTPLPKTREYLMQAMTLDKRGQLWTCVKDNNIIVFQEGEEIANYELADVAKCQSIVVASNGNVYVLSNDLIKVFDGKSWKTIAKGPDLMYSMSIDDQGKIWVGRFFGGLDIYNGNSWKSYGENNSPLVDDTNNVFLTNTINVISFDQAGRAWIGTDMGLYIFDGKEWQTNKNSVEGGVDIIVFDKNGKAWIGQHNAVTTFDGNNWTHFTPANSGLAPEVPVREILFDKQDRAWIMQGYEGQAPERDMFSVYDGIEWKYYYDNSVIDTAFSAEIDGMGRIWLCYEYKGCATLSTDESKLVSKFTGTLRLFLSSNGMMFIFVILFCTGLAYALNLWQGIWIGMSVGTLITAYLIFQMMWQAFSNVMFDYPKFHFGSTYLGLYLIIGGTLGGFIGKMNAQPEKPDNEKRGVILGWVIALVVYGCYFILFESGLT
jgi:ligand-binding sensor domain-containing protein